MSISRWNSNVSAKFNVIKTRTKLFNFWYKYLENIVLEMFEYDGLPETIPKDDLEFILIENGTATITKANDGKLYAFGANLGGRADVYYKPTISVIANPALEFEASRTIGTDCVVILNDKLYQGLSDYIAQYAALITSNLISFYWNIVNCRTQNIYESNNDEIYKNIVDVFEHLELGDELKVIASKPLFEFIKSREFQNSGITASSLKSLIETHQYLLGQFYIGIGLNANYNMKRESLSENEINANDDILSPNVDSMLALRQKGWDETNKMFGTNVHVRFASRWRKIKENESIESDDIKPKEENENG